MVTLLPGRLEVAATVAYEVAHVLSPMMQSRSSGRQLLYGRTAGFRNPRARIMSARVCVMRWGSRWSGNSRANRSATPTRFSAIAKSMTPPSEVMRPPSKAATTFLAWTAGNENSWRLSFGHGGRGVRWLAV
jgi:hypothetical protein